MARPSAALTMPVSISMVQWAREPARSWVARALSNAMDALTCSISALGAAAKRPPHMLLALVFLRGAGTAAGLAFATLARDCFIE